MADDGAIFAFFAERVIDALDKPFTIEGEEIVAGASVGIALHPEDDGGNAELLLRSAPHRPGVRHGRRSRTLAVLRTGDG